MAAATLLLQRFIELKAMVAVHIKTDSFKTKQNLLFLVYDDVVTYGLSLKTESKTRNWIEYISDEGKCRLAVCFVKIQIIQQRQSFGLRFKVILYYLTRL
jgi:hypothetical protein